MITVVGAGVAGLTCALALAERGAAVEVVERGTALGVESCSWLAGGMLAPWCELESADELVAELGAEALDYWAARFPGTVQNGSLVVARPRDQVELKRFSRRTRNFAWADGATLAALEPDLAERFGKAIFFPHEGHLDPRAALPALAERLAWFDVKIHFGIDVVASPPESAIVVDCRGLGARDRLEDLRGVKGEMVMVHSPDVTLSRPVRMLHPRHPLYVVPRGNGIYMIGATMVESDDEARVTARAVLELLGTACALHPAFAEAEVIELATGARPAFPDNLPRIRKAGRTLHVNGLFRHGFLLAPALAWRAASVILDQAYFPEVMDENPAQRQSA
jgi:glycine oxidase